MVVYALLGATGSTGSAILRGLISQPPTDLTLNILIRSKSKLLNAFPDLLGKTPFASVNIFEGTPDNATLLQECLKNADVIMACIASNYSSPDMTLCQDTAAAVISALEESKKTQGGAYKRPTILQLRSTSLNPALCAHAPWMAKTMAAYCFHYVYEDLRVACKLFESESDLLGYIYVDPPAIHDPDGVTPTGYKFVIDEPQSNALSYADLGAAFVELAERRGDFVGKAVGVSATGKVNLAVGKLLPFIATGLKSRLWG